MELHRRRLPDRRPSITQRIVADGQAYNATAGIDPETTRINEVFLAGGKVGSSMDAILGDAAVVISVALQHGVPIEALAKSVARIRTAPVTPEELDFEVSVPAALGQPRQSHSTIPATAIGAALDFLRDVAAETDEEGA